MRGHASHDSKKKKDARIESSSNDVGGSDTIKLTVEKLSIIK